MKIKELMQEPKKERGATMIEYALVVGLITLAGVAALQGVGEQIRDNLETVQEKLEEANDASNE